MNEKKKKNPEEEERNESEAAATVEEELEKMRQELEDVRKEKDDLTDRLQRVYADYANFQKRVPKNIADTVAYEKERFIRSFLPVLDNFDRTLREVSSAQSLDTVAQGVKIIYDQMLNILKTHGVQQIDSLHEKFDPERHEAMLRRSEPDKENDLILEEFQKGYVLNNRVLRPGRVAVIKVQAPAGPAQAKEEQVEQRTEPSQEEASPQGTDAAEAPSEPESSPESSTE